MSIDLKYFPGDKNYLLKTVQAFTKEALMDQWCRHAYQGYSQAENPMGLQDDFTVELQANISRGKFILDEAYDLLAAIYRFKYGDNQLTFIWDGRTHMEFYDETWKETVSEWTQDISRHPEIYRSIVKASLKSDNENIDFLKGSMKRFILRKFEINLTRSRVLRAIA